MYSILLLDMPQNFRLCAKIQPTVIVQVHYLLHFKVRICMQWVTQYFSGAVIFICLWIFMLQSEVEETLKRIQLHKGVQGVIVINGEGN